MNRNGQEFGGFLFQRKETEAGIAPKRDQQIDIAAPAGVSTGGRTKDFESLNVVPTTETQKATGNDGC
jgi:hypothetical protein